VERVNGVKIAELTQKVRQHAPKTGITAKPVQKEDINTRLKRLINSAEVNTNSHHVLFRILW